MAMLLISDEQLSRELKKLSEEKPSEQSSQQFINAKTEQSIKVVDIKHGRGNIHAIPQGLREVIAEEAITNGRTKDIAEAFGISKSSVDAYKNDATSTASYHTPNTELANKNKEVKNEISDSARSRLMMALESITQDKIEGAKVKDIASIAKDMSVVVKNMEPTGPLVQNNTQVVVYRPRTRDEEEFDIIEMNE